MRIPSSRAARRRAEDWPAHKAKARKQRRCKIAKRAVKPAAHRKANGAQ